MRRVLARLLGMRARALTLAEDEDIARAEAERRRWGSVDPVKKQETLRGFRFRTNADKRGGNVEILFQADTGEVTRAWFGPR